MQTDESVLVCEWGDRTWRERRVRIAPCPATNNTQRQHWPHELTVADVGTEGLSQVYCTCGWIGAGHATDELAVAAHNKPHGFEIVPISEWIVHENMADSDEERADLPF